MILIVDDDIYIRTSLTILLKRAGMESISASNPKEAIAAVKENEIKLILMDMNYSLTTTGEEGIFLLKQVKIFKPDVPVILITAWGSIQLAVEGMRAGAFDFITKPWNNVMLLNVIKTALELTDNSPQQSNLILENSAFSNIVGKSKAIQNILQTVSRVATTNASVLITGESGTGKELIAEAIHKLSKRESAPFVKVNLGGLSQSLFESEMFGHKKGAFTDAYSDRKGRFSIADKGSIFLDEIGDLELSCQVKLLRVLQEQTFEVLGDSKPQRVDVRVISATNKNLTEMVADGKFREDLLYRINLIPIHLPPLRERREDIPLLVSHFMEQSAKSHNINLPDISPEAMAFLQNLPLEGNVRELKNLIERTILLTDSQRLEVSAFEKHIHTPNNNSLSSLEDLEKKKIIEVLKLNDNNISQCAKSLGISRAALYRRLEKYNIAIKK